MSNLARIQWDFQEYLLREASAVGAHVGGTERVPLETRLNIYGHAYRARLIEALQSNYPIIAQLLGEADFGELANEYVALHDSRFFSIRYYGHALAQFLATDSRYRPVPFLADLARFEWTMAEVFDSADAESVAVAALAYKSPGDWATMRLTFHPSVRVLPLAWNAPKIWKAVIDEKERPRATVDREPTPWLLWRHALQEYFRPLGKVEAHALAAARAGENFGEICQVTCDHVREEDAPAQAATYLRGWIESGLVTALS